MGRRLRVTKKHIGRPVDFLGFDGKTYNGRIVDVLRRSYLVFTYYVSGIGEVRNVLDLRKHRDRVLEIW
jgi:hypothetical protein